MDGVLIENTIRDRSLDTQDQLMTYANEMLAIADEHGEYGEEINGEWTPYFTMEMESWARDVQLGLEAEILIADYDISDRAEWVREGSDFDEECQKATDEIADNLEIERNYENEDYVAINEWVNEQMTEYLEQ